MKIGYKWLLAGASALSVIASSAAAQTPPPRNLYVFGGSTVLTGNDGWFWDPQLRFDIRSYNLGDGLSDPALGWEGRNSNGPNWTERLGYNLGLSPGLDRLQDPWGGFSSANKGYNFAHALGSIDGVAKPSPYTLDRVANQTFHGQSMAPARSADGQIDAYNRFVSEGKITKRATDVFVHSFDPIPYCPRGTDCNTLDALYSATQAATANLIKYQDAAHARANVLVIGKMSIDQWANFDTTLIQGDFSALDRAYFAFGREIDNAYFANSALGEISSQLNERQNKAKTWFIDPNNLLADIRSNPTRYGIVHTRSQIYPITRVRFDGVTEDSVAFGRGNCLVDSANAGLAPQNCGSEYLWYRPGVLSSRGHDLMAYYVASTLGGVYAWDQYRAVGSGSGGAGTAASVAVATVGNFTGIAQRSLGLNQVDLGKGAKLFSIGFDGNDAALGFGQSNTGALRLIGSSAQVTPMLRVGATSFVDRASTSSTETRVRGSGATGFATLDLGSGMNLNVLAATQNRTLHTNRPILFRYVGGVARAKTQVRLDVAQASLERMFNVKGVQMGPSVGVATISERWGETRESGVPEWLALNRPETLSRTTALNLGFGANWARTDRNGNQVSVSAKAGRIQADAWTPIALVAPSQTLAQALEQERGRADFVTVSAGRESQRGWSFGLEAGIAKTEERRVEAVKARTVLRF